jgi:hypothetical protein
MIPVSKGDRFTWGEDNDETIAVDVQVVRVAQDQSWADLHCAVPGGSVWAKRQRLPLPASFHRVIGSEGR